MSQIEAYDGPTLAIRGTVVDYRTLAGGLFLALGVQFLTVIMLAAAMVPGYDFRGGAIRDGAWPRRRRSCSTALSPCSVC